MSARKLIARSRFVGMGKDLRLVGVSSSSVRDMLVVAVIIFLPTIFLAFAFPEAEMGLLGSGFLTWLTWHLVSPRVAALMLHGSGERSKLHKAGHSYFTFTETPTHTDDLKPMKLIKQAVYPLIFLFGATMILIPVLQHFGRISGSIGSTYDAGYMVGVLSFWTPFIWPVSLFVVPIKWTIERLGVRHMEHEKAVVRAVELSPYLADFLGFSIVYQFVFAIFMMGVDPTSAFIALLFYLLIMFPPALLMTTLYMRFSIDKHVKALQSSFGRKGYELTRQQLKLVKPELAGDIESNTH